MKRNVWRIVLAFSCLYFFGLILVPEVFFPGLAIMFFLSPFAGLFWLVFKRCKFTMGQLMASLLFFGATMSALSNLNFAKESGAVLGFAIVLTPLIGVGMFLGARAALKSDPKDNFRRWRYFLSGLFLPSSFLGFLALLSRISDPNWQFAIAMDFTVLMVSFFTVIHCINRTSEPLKPPDRVVPKICPDRV